MKSLVVFSRLLFVVIALLFVPASGRGSTTMTLQTANDLFAAGNAFYRGQQFNEAREAYFQLLQAGYDTAPVLYNLGTAEARLGSSTRAIAHLTRAKKLRPRDENIKANMTFVKPPPINAEGNAVSAESVWNRFYGFYTVREWLVLVWVGLFVACCGGALLLLSRHRRFQAMAVGMLWSGGGLLLIVSIPAATQYYHSQVVKKAIVVSASEMLSGPAERFTRIANLAEGQVVRSLESSTPEYRHVMLDNGLHGYVKRDALLKL